jgi:hypothetical protein
MNMLLLSAVFVIAVAVLVWIVALVFRGGAPTGESSTRADLFASGSGFGPDDMDTLRNKPTNLDNDRRA